MKILKKIKFSLILFFAFILVFSTTVSYADDDIVNHAQDLYLLDKSVIVDYSVKGNVFILAEDVTIDSNIMGNVFILAKNVNIKSKTYVNSSVFVCANSVTIDGVIFDLYSLSDNLSISANSRILRDITASGNTLDLTGSIQRNANLGFDTINVSSNTASIAGNLSYTASSSSVPKQIVGGEYNFSELVAKVNTRKVSDYLEDLLKVLVISIIIILIIIFATPRFANKEQQILINKLPISIGYGTIALIAIPVICFLLFCTILGIMPAISILFAYLFVILQMSSVLVAVPIAKTICNKINKNTNGITILISMLLIILIWCLEQIPVIGNIIWLLVTILGLGILVYAIIHPKIEITSKKIVAQASTIIEPHEGDTKPDNKKEAKRKKNKGSDKK